MFICMVIPVAGLAKTVELPISIDYPLLRTLTIHTAFAGPDETARLLTVEDGCTTVTVADPRFSPHNGLVRLEVFVDLHAGKSFGAHCFMPISWQGYAVLFQQPKIDPGTWQLSFKTVDSIILDRHHQPAKIAAILWKLMESWVYPYLNRIRIDLTPPVADLKHILFPMFPSNNLSHTQKILDSMRPGNIRTAPDQVRINILIDAVAPSPAPDDTSQPAAPLSDSELDQFIRVWETWDALLVHMISSLAGKSLSDADRQTLLETLLDTRHRFSAGLAGDPMAKDFVKEQFLWAWKQMAAIFRKNLSETTSKQSLGYLAFFTASDALAALDKLGPSFGIEISREGLIRLARLLEGSAESLEYRPETDNQLREISGFDPIDNNGDGMGEPLPPFHPDDPDKNHFGLRPFLNFLISPRLAMAGEKK